MLIIAQVLKRKIVYKSRFLLIHKQQTNFRLNEAANDSAWVSGQDFKKPPSLRTNQIAEFGEFCMLAKATGSVNLPLLISWVKCMWFITKISTNIWQISPSAKDVPITSDHYQKFSKIFKGRQMQHSLLRSRFISSWNTPRMSWRDNLWSLFMLMAAEQVFQNSELCMGNFLWCVPLVCYILRCVIPS